MSPVLSPSVGGLGTIGNRTEVLGAVLGPGAGSVRWDRVGPGWDVEAGGVAIPGLGGTEVHTASMLALPGMATELQLGEEEVCLGDNSGQKGSAWLGPLTGDRPAGKESQQPGCRRQYWCHPTPSEPPLSVPPAPALPQAAACLPPCADFQAKATVHLLAELGPAHQPTMGGAIPDGNKAPQCFNPRQ